MKYRLQFIINKVKEYKKIIQEKNTKVDSIYKKVLVDLNNLNNQQKAVANSYIKKLEQKKIEEVKKSILE